MSLRAGSKERASRPIACIRGLWAPTSSIISEVWEERSCAYSRHLCGRPKKAPTPSSGWPRRSKSKGAPGNISSTGKSRRPIRNHTTRRSRRGCGMSASGLLHTLRRLRWSYFDGQQCCLEYKRHDHEKRTIKINPQPGKAVRRKRKYDEEFKQQALSMVRNG